MCPAAPTNGSPCKSSIATRRFPYEKHTGTRVSHPEHRLRAPLRKRAAATSFHRGANLGKGYVRLAHLYVHLRQAHSKGAGQLVVNRAELVRHVVERHHGISLAADDEHLVADLRVEAATGAVACAGRPRTCTGPCRCCPPGGSARRRPGSRCGRTARGAGRRA